MRRREYDLTDEPVRAKPRPAAPRKAPTPSPVAELQRSLGGNQATASVLARKPVKTKGTFEHSVRIGKLGPVEIKESNVSDWTSGKSGASDLVITTAKGKHSEELKRMAGGSRVDSIEVTTVTGQNTWIVVTFRHGLIRDYEEDSSAKTETWKLTRFDAVDIKRLAIGAARQ
ncbi:MAG TPA: hypothetical protein VH418_19350 [Solirubrobacteraceae bacterium]|jgi:hypothetical protein